MSRPLLFALLFLTACVSRPPEKISQELPFLEAAHLAGLKEHYDLRLDRATTTYNPGIGGLCLRYTSEELFDICEARNLLVDLVDSLLYRMTIDPLVGSELSYPLGVENLDIIITFDCFFGRFIDLQYVNQIRLQDGVVRYYAFTAFDCDAEHFEKHTEAYRTAQLNSQAYRMAGRHKDSCFPDVEMADNGHAPEFDVFQPL